MMSVLINLIVKLKKSKSQDLFSGIDLKIHNMKQCVSIRDDMIRKLLQTIT